MRLDSIPGLWTPDRGLPDGARAIDWLREQRRLERYRWRHVRDRKVEYHAAAPTLVSYTESAAWNTAGTSKATGSISWNAGDIFVVIAGCEDASSANVVPNVPTATGLTFASVQTSGTGATFCSSRLSTATAAGTSSSAVTVTMSSGTPHWGFGVWVWRGSTGVGNSIEQHTATQTKALTITSANSGVCCGVFDFNAGATGSGTPAPTNTRQNAQDAGRYTRLVFDNIDYSTSGTGWGQTGGGTTGPFSIVAVEILNTGGGAATTWGPWMVNGLSWNRMVYP